MVTRGLVRGLALLSLLVLVLGNAWVWGPLWWHFRVVTPELDPAVVERHRQLPADAVLNTVAEASMLTDHPLRGDAALQAARRILAGELAMPALPVMPLEDGFHPDQLERGVPVYQVFIASLVVPDLLLRAHEHAPDPVFVQAALRYVLGFAAHEARVQFPGGLLANAHPVSNRAAVLARLWRHVRTQADPAAAAELHRLALRTGVLLARPAHFTAATNHGVMQNVALLQLAAAFPALPQAEGWRKLALQRLALQRPAYIGPDGGVLEHALGYHFHGVVVSGYIVRLLEAMQQPVPPEWRRAHADSSAYMATLQRPDGSLPPIGNTYRYQWRLPLLVQPDPAAWLAQLQDRPSYAALFPVSGTAVWWDAPAGAAPGVQTVVPWGWFHGHGHARAQELSLLIWSAGTDWSTNTGYWPNSDAQGYQLASDWAGSNAPHVLGEAWQGPRRSHVRATGAREGLRFLDIERVVPEGPRVRRQVLQWQARQWLVLDSFDDPQRRELRVVWTSAPETVQAAAGERAYTLAQPGVPLRFSVAVDGGAGVRAAPLHGSRSPFGGWVAVDRKATPAPAVDARLPADGGWMLATLQLSALGDAAPLRGRMQRYGGPEDWSIELPLPEGPVTLTRQGARLDVAAGAQGSGAVALSPGPSVDAELAAIQAAHEARRREYPRFRTAEAERRERSLLIVGGVAAAWVLLWLLARWRRRAAAAAL